MMSFIIMLFWIPIAGRLEEAELISWPACARLWFLLLCHKASKTLNQCQWKGGSMGFRTRSDEKAEIDKWKQVNTSLGAREGQKTFSLFLVSPVFVKTILLITRHSGKIVKTPAYSLINPVLRHLTSSLNRDEKMLSLRVTKTEKMTVRFGVFFDENAGWSQTLSNEFQTSREQLIRRKKKICSLLGCKSTQECQPLPLVLKCVIMSVMLTTQITG